MEGAGARWMRNERMILLEHHTILEPLWNIMSLIATKWMWSLWFSRFIWEGKDHGTYKREMSTRSHPLFYCLAVTSSAYIHNMQLCLLWLGSCAEKELPKLLSTHIPFDWCTRVAMSFQDYVNVDWQPCDMVPIHITFFQ